MIEKLINEKLLEETKSKHVSSGKWKPSSFGYCYRRQFWQRLGEEGEPLDLRTLRIFKVGNLFHDFVEGFLPHTEQVVETDDIKGYADIVENDCVSDIKTQHSRAFWYAKKPEYDVKKEKEPNWLQVAWYALQLGKKYCRIVFISKDDLTMNEYQFPAEDFKEKVDNELSTLRNLWKNGVLPPATPRLYNGKECEWCQYQKKCKGEKNETKQ